MRREDKEATGPVALPAPQKARAQHAAPYDNQVGNAHPTKLSFLLTTEC